MNHHLTGRSLSRELFTEAFIHCSPHLTTTLIPVSPNTDHTSMNTDLWPGTFTGVLSFSAGCFCVPADISLHHSEDCGFSASFLTGHGVKGSFQSQEQQEEQQWLWKHLWHESDVVFSRNKHNTNTPWPYVVANVLCDWRRRPPVRSLFVQLWLLSAWRQLPELRQMSCLETNLSRVDISAQLRAQTRVNTAPSALVRAPAESQFVTCRFEVWPLTAVTDLLSRTTGIHQETADGSDEENNLTELVCCCSWFLQTFTWTLMNWLMLVVKGQKVNSRIHTLINYSWAGWWRHTTTLLWSQSKKQFEPETQSSRFCWLM